MICTEKLAKNLLICVKLQHRLCCCCVRHFISTQLPCVCVLVPFYASLRFLWILRCIIVFFCGKCRKLQIQIRWCGQNPAELFVGPRRVFQNCKIDIIGQMQQNIDLLQVTFIKFAIFSAIRDTDEHRSHMAGDAPHRAPRD